MRIVVICKAKELADLVKELQDQPTNNLSVAITTEEAKKAIKELCVNEYPRTSGFKETLVYGGDVIDKPVCECIVRREDLGGHC